MTDHGSDKASWAHDYCSNYEHWFGSLRDEPVILLELGIGGEKEQLGGASLKGWEEYFPNAKIYGLDIFDKHQLDTDRIKTYWGYQEDEEYLSPMMQQIGNCNIIIDDASHINKFTIKSFQILFPLLSTGGLYIIEDLTCSYRWDFGGNTNIRDTTTPTIMNYLFSILHSLNPIEKVADENYKRPQEFEDIESVHFYPDMVVIKKK